MKALLFAGAWLAVGVLVASRRPAPPAERLLSALFWPLFLLAPTTAAPASSSGPVRPVLQRLRAALHDDDPAASVVHGLEAALARLDARYARVEAALADVGPAESGAVGEARERSRALLEEARAAVIRERDDALAAIEEATARLVVASETGDRVEVAGLLRALHARLDATREVG